MTSALGWGIITWVGAVLLFNLIGLRSANGTVKASTVRLAYATILALGVFLILI